jgi:hypothetical protein
VFTGSVIFHVETGVRLDAVHVRPFVNGR